MAEESVGEAPRLSVVIATREGWSGYRPMYEAHRRALDSLDAEIVVVDGSSEEIPPADLLSPRTRWLKHPGESVLALRLRGYRAARGEIVAQSEDHVRVPPDWGEAILRAHADYPDAAAIGGSCENGSTGSVAEWAAYFVGHGRFMPPLGIGTPAAVLGLANVTYKRWAILDIAPVEGLGVNEAVHQRALARQGGTLLYDDRIRSEHLQSLDISQGSQLMFHAGRAMAATRRARMGAGEWARLVVTPISPPALVVRLGLTVLRRRRYRREFLAAAPLVTWLFACRAMGEMVGYIRGPSDSAMWLH